MMRSTAISIVLIAAFSLTAELSAVPTSTFAQGRRTVTATRLVAEFSELEERLAGAIQHKDEATLGMLLSADFEQWTPAPPGDPMPREEWLRNVSTSLTLESFRLGQMAVRNIDNSDLVSFVLSRKAVCDGRDCSGNFFVIDLWQEQRSGTAQLLVRYQSLNQATLERPWKRQPRPTGKE